MASQRQVCAFILTSSLALASLISQAAACASEPDDFSDNSSEDNSKDRVNLSVYYESLCPYCAEFIVNHLVKIFQTDLIDIVNLRLVPWGNTQILPNNTWICQHGADECKLDVTEACAINAWPRVQTHFKFIHCVESLHLMNRHAKWPSCFSANNLNRQPLDNCHNTGLGYQLEKAYADETANLIPRHRFVPWVVVNNYPLQEDFHNFVGYICRAYRGYVVPNACKSSSFEINSSEAATSAPQFCPQGR